MSTAIASKPVAIAFECNVVMHAGAGSRIRQRGFGTTVRRTSTPTSLIPRRAFSRSLLTDGTGVLSPLMWQPPSTRTSSTSGGVDSLNGC